MLSALFFFIKTKVLEALHWLSGLIKQPPAAGSEITPPAITPTLGIRAEANIPTITAAAAIADSGRQRRQRRQTREDEVEL